MVEGLFLEREFLASIESHIFCNSFPCDEDLGTSDKSVELLRSLLGEQGLHQSKGRLDNFYKIPPLPCTQYHIADK